MSGVEPLSTRFERIAKLASEDPDRVLTSLNQFIDIGWLREAFRRTRKSGAVGVDGKTAWDYEENLEENLADLLERFKSGRYKAPPVRRVHIPKGDGSKTRPIGIPTFEDKVLQRAVAMALEPIYEQDFLPCSYGFRPGRSAHQALQELWNHLMKTGGGWVLEVDIKSYFDTIDWSCLGTFLDRRVRDGVLRRAIGKWLKAGVMEDGALRRTESGTPQGGVISPLLSNVYLHEVLDRWFFEQVEPRLEGRAKLIRFADDVIIAFAMESDARRVMEVLPKRFARFGLTVHPEKTRLVDFRRPPRPPSRGRLTRDERPESFDLLGFTHHWTVSRKGKWAVRRKTQKSRLARALKALSVWMRGHRHWTVREQHSVLKRKLQGHYAYYGITGNSRALGAFRTRALLLWRKWLGRRSGKTRMSWERFELLTQRYPLPPAIALHSTHRIAAKP